MGEVKSQATENCNTPPTLTLPRRWGGNLFLLPLLMTIWANTHGSFFLGFLPLGAYGLEAIYTKNWKWLKNLLIISALCLLATLLNPYGIFVYEGVLKTITNDVAKYITEFQPFEFGKVMGASVWLIMLVLVSDLKGNKSPLADKILVVLSLLAMLFASRNIGVLAILGAPYLASNMPEDDLRDEHTAKLKKFAENFSLSPKLLAVCVVAAVGGFFLLPILGKNHYFDDAKTSPAAAVEYALTHYPNQNIFNDYDLGGQIIFLADGKLPVFVDGRAGTVYSKETLEDYISFGNQSDGWEKMIDKYNINALLLQKGSNFENLYNKGLYRNDFR